MKSGGKTRGRKRPPDVLLLNAQQQRLRQKKRHVDTHTGAGRRGWCFKSTVVTFTSCDCYGRWRRVGWMPRPHCELEKP